jgi:hypothetical protein
MRRGQIEAGSNIVIGLRHIELPRMGREQIG